jgi:hypothetical protein
MIGMADWMVYVSFGVLTGLIVYLKMLMFK